MPIPDVVRKPRISWRREWRLRAEEAGRKLAEVTQQRDAIKDALQTAFNNGAFLCQLAGRDDKSAEHEQWCLSCRVRAWLTPGWYLRDDKTLRTLREGQHP